MKMCTAASTAIDIHYEDPIQFSEKTEIRIQSFGSAAGSTLFIDAEFERV
jgi:hypothetical protein